MVSRRLRVGAAGLFGVVAALGIAGAGFEAVSARGDAEQYAPTGRMVDVGGSRMHISCSGTGSPTVVLDAGLSGSSLDWSLVQPSIATSTRVCSYDRAGMGWSDPVQESRSPEQIARELHTLLTAAEIAPPYVLVGHSLAGKNIRMFAMEHPNEVVGMVLVDARSEVVDGQASDGEVRMLRLASRVQGWAFRAGRRVGLVRLSGAHVLGFSAFGGETGKVMALKVTDSNAVSESTAELVERASSDDQLRAAPPLGDMPLIVLAADKSMTGIPFWPESQRALASLSSRGRLIVVNQSDHYIHVNHPAVAIQAIQDVTANARLRAGLSPAGSGATAP